MTNSLALVLAEPEPEMRGYLERHLSHDGFEVLGTERGGEALELAERVKPDIVLVDSALPDSSGLDVCRRIREGEPGRSWNRQVPVIVLGDATADAVDRVRAFERGCDDYVARPFFYEELLARIRAVLRRSCPPPAERFEAGALVVDSRTRRVMVGKEPVLLAGREFELLVRLASEPARVFTKEELLRDVWGFRSIGRTRTIDSHASRLRRKLNSANGGGDFVVNVWGVGYKLVDA
jgi:DNA-binding response OmpR family regulator